MDDLYVEQIVEKEESKKDSFKRVLIVAIACVFTIIFSFLFGDPVHASPLIIIVAIVANWFFKRLNIEYEYIFTNGTLDIDCIYNKAKRKSLYSFNVSDFIVMAHIDDKERFAGYSALPVRNLSSGEIYGNTYMFITYHNKQNVKFIIEPNAQLLDAMLKYMTPRKLFVKK